MRNINKDFFLILLLIIIGAGVYANTFSNQFVYDDQVTVRENLFIRDWKNLSRFFSADYYLRSEEYSFRPLVTLTYFLDYSWSGVDPRGYHLTNLLLHLLCVGAVFFLSRKLLNSREAAFLAALIFTVHPTLVEAAAGISFREDLLCAFFFLISLLAYIKSEKEGLSGPKPIFYSFSIFFFLLALLSKEMAVTFPLIIAAYELIVHRQRLSDLIRPRVVILFLIAGLYLLARFLLLYQRQALPAAPDFGNIFTRLILVIKGVGLYGRLILFPLKLTVEYPDPLPPVIWGNYLLLPSLLTSAFLLWTWLKSPGGGGQEIRPGLPDAGPASNLKYRPQRAPGSGEIHLSSLLRLLPSQCRRFFFLLEKAFFAPLPSIARGTDKLDYSLLGDRDHPSESGLEE